MFWNRDKHVEKKGGERMRFYYVALKLKLKELLRNKAYIAVLGVLPLLIGLIMSYGAV